MILLRVRSAGVYLLIGMLAVCLIGCSTGTPINSTDDESSLAISLSAETLSPPDTRVQFVAVVATIDIAQRMLTFVDREETVIAAEDCQIVEVVAGVQTEIEFGDIEVDDRVKVCGQLQEDDTVLAHRICIYMGQEFCQYDLAFRDTVTTIDYGAGSFTVKNRVETIVVDENTNIWGVLPAWHRGSNDNTNKFGTSNNIEQSDDSPLRERHVTYELSDIQIGDILEVKANILDENTLYAVSIKMANSGFNACTEFESVLASVDYEERVVTFEDNDWIGNVCMGAQLLNAGGAPITLEDFVSGESVYVKGHPVSDTDNLLKICVMSKLD